ncbi:ATPase 3 [Zea mays]|uniref:AAA-ATPase ASD mitochondrial n=1 Tax=Zea mays TaxID=4577 RepID=B4FNH5_MAIZE|nr:ATPase 3 [Zea mays]ACF83668.1 unknown [Zea mays]ONM16413.1 AAA-ATPase ASD mitochondrial [Zea mays]|eukprot:NP_001148126.2 ATPase 3 [Zea mays]
MAVVDRWAGLGSALASFLFLWSMVQRHVPVTISHRVATWANKLVSYFNPYVEITISEYGAERFRRSDFFLAAEAYLSDACAPRARKLKAELGRDSSNLQVSVGDNDEVTDAFQGATVWWYVVKKVPRSNVISLYANQDDPRTYRVVFHRRHRDLVVGKYLPHVLKEGRAVTVRNRQRRLFTNNPSGGGRGRGDVWSHVPFEHPSTFDTLAMDPDDKEAVVDDLEAFREAKDYYTKVGKAWKRGYLLYGPPGTGKSTMIAAMANLLDYDVYDLELTAVNNNTDLRKLFIETTGKSIIVVEDIDCSVDLTGKRKDKKQADKKSEREADDKPKLPMEPEKDEGSKITLSGMLNFIDGLWSACGGERIIIFTTNHKDKLEPALIRRGRMDRHIEMSYCRFPAFKVLAKNYLDVEEHELFDQIGQLLEETDMSPADVAENLMSMSKKKKRDANACLESLVKALKQAKEEAAKAKVEAEAKKKVEAAAEAAKSKEEDEAKEGSG